MPDTIVDYDSLEPHAEEDVRLVLQAELPDNANMLDQLKLENWQAEFPFLDPVKRVRLLGGLGMRIMGVTRILHWEVRQRVEGFLGFVLQSILTGTYPRKELSLRAALLAIGIEVQSGGAATLQLTDIDLHKATSKALS